MKYKIMTEDEWDHVAKCMNWGESTFDAEAIQILNHPSRPLNEIVWHKQIVNESDEILTIPFSVFLFGVSFTKENDRFELDISRTATNFQVSVSRNDIPQGIFYLSMADLLKPIIDGIINMKDFPEYDPSKEV